LHCVEFKQSDSIVSSFNSNLSPTKILLRYLLLPDFFPITNHTHNQVEENTSIQTKLNNLIEEQTMSLERIKELREQVAAKLEKKEKTNDVIIASDTDVLELTLEELSVVSGGVRYVCKP
jgi:hypothetical protein